MINANISITDYFSLIESYPGLGNAYLSNLKNTLMNMGYTAAGWTYLADEHHIYGSSRVGVHNTHFVLAKRFSTAEMEYTQKTGNQVHFIRGKRNYELSNHLGNVQVVISDKRISVCDNELQTERFEADILMATDYYPFGMAIPERQWYTGSDSSNYRYGFNGMERDDEAKCAGSHYNTEFRQYDPRIGRWFSVDPKMMKYPSWSPYNFAFNNPLYFTDLNGEDPIEDLFKKGESKSKTFLKLAKQAEINENNITKIISYGDVSATSPETGVITINKGRGNELASLTHELTNRKNAKKLRMNNYKVRFGIISAKEYAKKILEIELEGLLNQFIVMNESGESFGNEYMDALLAEFTDEDGKLDKNGLKKRIDDENKNGNLKSADTGDSLIDKYTKQGQNIRDNELERTKKSNRSPKEQRKYERKEKKKAKTGPNFKK